MNIDFPTVYSSASDEDKEFASLKYYGHNTQAGSFPIGSEGLVVFMWNVMSD